MPFKGKKVSVVIPTYNEELAIGVVIRDLKSVILYNEPVCDEIIVVNNCSSDKTREIALNCGAKVVDENKKGYGYACQTGINACSATTDIVVFVDGDRSCKGEELPLLLEVLLSGADICIGNREKGKQEKRALFYHQQLGNYFIMLLIHILWSEEINDLGPFRAIWIDKLHNLNMSEMTFGWTVEMQLKALLNKYKVKEVPVSSLSRIGKSKISGTVRGTVLAAYGIIKVILLLKLRTLIGRRRRNYSLS